jgi:hypothetical protein
MILAISLAYPSRLGAGLFLAHGDYYLPSRLLEKVEVEDSTPWIALLFAQTPKLYGRIFPPVSAYRYALS